MVKCYNRGEGIDSTGTCATAYRCPNLQYYSLQVLQPNRFYTYRAPTVSTTAYRCYSP